MFAGILLLLLLLPFLMLSILTFHDFPHHNIQQEFCFNPKLASIIGVYSGLGKVMPIWRGGGINQKLLLNFARRSAAGDWIHVFPEGMHASLSLSYLFTHVAPFWSSLMTLK